MSRTKFTERKAEALRLAREYPSPHDYFDTHVDALCLTVRPTGCASWCLRYRFAGRQRRLTLGRSPGVSVEAARKAARHYLGLIAQGRDPAAEKIQARQKAKPSELYPSMAEVFIRRHAIPNNRTWREQARTLGLRFNRLHMRWHKRGAPLGAEALFCFCANSLAERWADKRASEITKKDVVTSLHELVDQGKFAAANARLCHLRSMFNWLKANGLVEHNPCDGVPTPASAGQRDRVLDDRELTLIWNAAGLIEAPFRQFVRLLILTAQRRREVSGLQWCELNGAAWTIPGSRAKNGDPHLVPLPPLALAELALLPRVGPHALTNDREGRKSMQSFAAVKDRLTAAKLTIDPVGIPQWGFHDLRRTAATGMASIGIAPHVIEALLNHRTGTIRGIARIYNRHLYEVEKREALLRWADYVARIARGHEELPIAAGVMPAA